MLRRRHRNLLVAFAWGLALASAPYATVVVLEFDPTAQVGALISNSGFVTTGMVFFTASFFLMAMLCSKFNEDMNEATALLSGEHDDEEDDARHDGDLLAEGQEYGLKLLRLASDSPLRGKVMEKAIIRFINGQAPATAAEANGVLTLGANEIEWVDRLGNIKTTTFVISQKDLKVQFEQVKRIKDTEG